MANDALTVKVEFDKENAMNCIKNVFMEEYGMALDELAELCKAKQEGRLVIVPYKAGAEVWVVEKDEYGEACDFSGNVFICEVNGYCIVSGYLNGCGDVDYILSDQAVQTVEEYNGSLAVYPACDCYKTREEAEAKLKEAQRNG